MTLQISESTDFDQTHLKYWGSLYEPQDAEIEWHGESYASCRDNRLILYLVPSKEEIEFALEILDKIASPALSKIEVLAKTADHWDEVARNDFCRYVRVRDSCRHPAKMRAR